jgi:hypothetical protein
MRHEWASVSRRIDFWDFLTWLMLTTWSVIFFLVLRAVFDFNLSQEETLETGAAMAAFWLLLLAAMR